MDLDECFRKGLIKKTKIDKELIKSLIEMSGIKESFHYKFFSKKGKNYFRTAKEFTEKILNTEINTQSKIYFDKNEMEKAKKNFNISDQIKNIVCGISASGSTKRWDIKNYIKLFDNLNLLNS